MRAHTITTKASTIVSGGILALGLAVVLLAATASTASASRIVGTWNCQPPPAAPSSPVDDPQIQSCFGGSGGFNFGYHQLGTSASQRFALGVSNDTFSPRIGVSGDYAQTNNCPPTLSAPNERVQGCIIDVTFTPTGKGPRRGTLTTGPGGPTVALNGGGEPVNTTPPDLQLSGPKKQNPQADGPICDRDLCDVKVKASCGYETCTLSANGKLTKVNNDKLKPIHSWVVAPGKTTSLEQELNETQRKQVRKALDEGKNVRAKVTVRAKDAAGKVTTAKRTIRLVKGQRSAARRVEALGAQTAAAAPDVVKYDTELTISKDMGIVWGYVESKVRNCELRRVVLFKKRPGADRKLRSTQSHHLGGAGGSAWWKVKDGSIRRELQPGDVLYAKVRREVHDEFVCRGDRSGPWGPVDPDF